MGTLENVFGDANLCIKREVFAAVGGFTERRNLAFEDWEFLATVALAGYQLDVIPKALFHYRRHASSMLQTSRNDYGNFLRAISPYLRRPTFSTEELLKRILVPLQRQLAASQRYMRGAAAGGGALPRPGGRAAGRSAPAPPADAVELERLRAQLRQLDGPAQQGSALLFAELGEALQRYPVLQASASPASARWASG